MLDLSGVDVSGNQWPMLFMKCELCNFETVYPSEIQAHIQSAEHQERESFEGRKHLSWFFYFGKLENHIEIE